MSGHRRLRVRLPDVVLRRRELFSGGEVGSSRAGQLAVFSFAEVIQCCGVDERDVATFLDEVAGVLVHQWWLAALDLGGASAHVCRVETRDRLRRRP
jgi:hypothetical protein